MVPVEFSLFISFSSSFLLFADDIVKSNSIILINELIFNLLYVFIKFVACLSDLKNFLQRNVIETNRSCTSCCDINFIKEQERSVIYNRPSIESLYDEVYSIFHSSVNLNHTVLNNVKFIGFITNINNN
jgi:hypothetical protein